MSRGVRMLEDHRLCPSWKEQANEMPTNQSLTSHNVLNVSITKHPDMNNIFLCNTKHGGQHRDWAVGLTGRIEDPSSCLSTPAPPHEPAPVRPRS